MASIKTIIPLLLFLSALASHVQVLATGPCSLQNNVTVAIGNLLPSESAPLILSCKSKEVDLGNATLTARQNFELNFCKSTVPNAVFTCSLSWSPKSATFTAYDSKVSAKCKKTNQCWWFTQTDGIYFTDTDKITSSAKVYNWDK